MDLIKDIIGMVKYTYILEIQEKKWTFTELSIGDHIEIKKQYPNFDGNLLDLVQREGKPDLEAILLVLLLMTKHEHEEVTEKDFLEIPARVLPTIYEKAIIGVYGQGSEDTDKKKSEIVIL